MIIDDIFGVGHRWRPQQIELEIIAHFNNVKLFPIYLEVKISVETRLVIIFEDQ